MSNAGKFILGFVGVFALGLVWFFSKRLSKGSDSDQTTYDNLAKAREAKLAKSILKKSENEESKNTPDTGI
jgi:hypothetical protein